MTKLNTGDKAPLIDKIIDLQKMKTDKLIIFFYPKDNTPGCTAEACNLRDNYELLENKGYTIIGISPDSEASHEKFTTKHKLPFSLIPDTEKEILTAYGVWGPKKFLGKSYTGVLRTTFVITKEGIIEKIYDKVQTKTHTEQILKSYEG